MENKTCLSLRTIFKDKIGNEGPIGLKSSHLFHPIPVVLLIAMIMGCSEKNGHAKLSKNDDPAPVKIIFETDMGNDIDDALALDMLYKYADQNRVELLAVTTNKNNKYSPLFVDVFNKWYGYPDVPIGTVANGADSESGSKNFAQATWEHRIDGKRAFSGIRAEHAQFPDAVDLYREILAGQPDHSVTVVSVGFSTNIARLLHTPADEFSSLNGRELIAKKVKLLSVMAGNFDENRMTEYNVVMDIKSAQKVFAEWPTEVVASPWELGNKINYPASSIQNDFNWEPHHPLVVAYENYLPMPYDRPTWDLTSVIYAVEGGEYFSLSSPGELSVDDEGYTDFVENPDGAHRYLKASPEQAAVLKDRFVGLITTPPRNRE